MISVANMQIGIGNCGGEENRLLASTYRRVSARHKEKEGRTGQGFFPYAELASRQMSNDWVTTSCALCS